LKSKCIAGTIKENKRHSPFEVSICLCSYLASKHGASMTARSEEKERNKFLILMPYKISGQLPSQMMG